MNQGPTRYHEAVMVGEVIELMGPIGEGTIVDATFGGGGHSRALLDALAPEVDILALDRDSDALSADVGNGRLRLIRARFGDLATVLKDEEVMHLTGTLFDLGVSSHQLDTPDRGFSYRSSGPLDMRMGTEASLTASEIVNEWSKQQLEELIRRYGEERFSRRIARAIVDARPIFDTVTLADTVAASVPSRRKGHPARLTFQALRIAVNDELGELDRGLDAAVDNLAPGGRCVVISYHSLEDRRVKRRFAQGAKGCVCPPELPVCVCEEVVELRVLTRSVVRPLQDEVDRNPRARSARLRAAEKVAA